MAEIPTETPADNPPPAPWHATPATPLRTGLRLFRPLLFIVGLLLVVLVLALATLRWSLFSPVGSRWIVGHLPLVQVQGFSGTLGGPQWKADKLSLRWSGGQAGVEIEGLSVSGQQWHGLPSQGAWLGLDIAELKMHKLHLDTGPASPGPGAAGPLELPQSIAGPLRLRVAQTQLDELEVDDSISLQSISLQGLVLDPAPGAQHRIDHFSLQGFGVAGQGSLHIATDAPLALGASVSLQPAFPEPAASAGASSGASSGAIGAPPRWTASVAVDGPLARLAVAGTLRGQAARLGEPAPALDLQATLQPLQVWKLVALDLRTQALDLAALSPRLPVTRLGGVATLAGGGSGTPLVASLDLHNTQAGRWDERGLPLQSLSLHARRLAQQPDRLDLTDFDVGFADRRGPAGHWSGSAVWQGPTLALQSRLADMAPERLDGRAAAMTLGGPVTLSLQGLPAPDGKTAPSTLSASWKLDLEGRLSRSPQPVRLRLEGSVDDQHLDLRELHAQAGAASADLQASLSREAGGEWRVQSHGEVRNFDPQPWWPGAPGAIGAGPGARGAIGVGPAAGRHRLSGDWRFEFRLPANADQLPPLALAQRMVGNGRLNIHDSLLAGVPLAGQIELGYTQAAAPVPGSLTAELDIGGNHLSIEGRGDPAGSGLHDEWRAEIKAQALQTLAPLAGLSPALADWIPRQGSVEASLAADGRWPSLHTEGRLHVSQLLVGPLTLARGNLAWAMNTSGARPLALQLDLAGMQYGSQRADSVHAQLRGTLASHHIEISGAMPVLPPALAVQMLGIEAQSGTQAQLVADGAWLPDPAGGGRWQAKIDHLIIGSWDGGTGTAPPASGWAEMKNLQAELQFDAQRRLVALQADPGRVMLSDTLALRWDAVSLDLRGAQPQLVLRADIEPFPLAPLLARAWPGVGWQGDLKLGAKIDIRAADKVDADLVFERSVGDLQIADASGVQLLGLTDFRIALSAHDGLWKLAQHFRGRSLGEVSSQLEAHTTPDRRWPEPEAPLQGHLEARAADLGIWGSWVPPGWRLTGEMHGAAEITGQVGKPEYSGQVTGSGLGVRNLLQGVNVTDGELALRLQGDSAQIERFVLHGGDGSLNITGQATLGPKPHAELALKADHFRVLGRVDRQIVSSGNAELRFDGDQTRIEGKFGIDDGLIDVSSSDAPSLDEDVTVRRPGAAGPQAQEAAAPKIQRDLVLDVTVDLGQKMHVRGHGLNTDLRGDLHITNPNGRLAVNGSIRTEGGTYVAYGQNLKIERGVVTFSGGVDNPRLDVLALRPDLDTQKVGVQILGNVQDPRVRLYSDPDMVDGDKLSWLLLGRAPDNLGRNDAAMLQQAALALLAGEGKSPTDTLLHSIGLDQLSIHQSENTDVPGTVVSLGKQISENWTVGYERGVNATAGNWQLIYRLAQRFTLRLQAGQDNSADVIWSWRLQAPPADAAKHKTSIAPR
jgi:translocation and assembly module TamB